MKKYLKTTLLVVVAAIFIGTFIFLYQKSEPQTTVYETVTPEIADLKKTTVATGKVEPRDEILIRPRTSDIISEVYKEAGQAIRRGEMVTKVKVIPELSQLDSAENRVRVVEINAAQIETDFGRTKKLYSDKLISGEEFKKSEVDIKRARKELQTVKDALEIIREGITKNNASPGSTLIRSTIDGLILNVPIEAGNSVIMDSTFNDGATIVTIANMNDLIFKGRIDEIEVGCTYEGMPVKLTVGASQNLTLDTELGYISPRGAEENGANQSETKAVIHTPDSVQIRSGCSADAKIVLQYARRILAAPEGIIEFSGDSTFAWVVADSVPEQKFERRQIKTNMSNDIKLEIKKGLTGKEKVRASEKKGEQVFIYKRGIKKIQITNSA